MSKYPIRKLALTGRIRSGKDTVADYLAEKYAFEKFAFAGAMKFYLHRLFPHIPSDPKPRRAYQVFGEGLRNLDLPGAADVWVDACLRQVDAHTWWHAEVDERGANVVITDLRTPREYERLRAEGFTIIRVTAPDQLRMDRAVEAGDDFTVHDFAHETELHVDSFEVDYEIVNDGTVEELKAKVDEVIAKINAE
jgi:dephospho-CoA kinase